MEYDGINPSCVVIVVFSKKIPIFVCNRYYNISFEESKENNLRTLHDTTVCCTVPYSLYYIEHYMMREEGINDG